jgi:hypothetical protein
MSNERYDYDPEHGNDFTYDEHGNVIYGRGYIGPPRRPMHYGLDVKNFLEEYLKIDKISRVLYLNSPDKDISDELKVLITILRIYEENDNKNRLKENLKRFVRFCLPDERRTDDLQLKYFRYILKLI